MFPNFNPQYVMQILTSQTIKLAGELSKPQLLFLEVHKDDPVSLFFPYLVFCL
jgi:hypothetical protein